MRPSTAIVLLPLLAAGALVARAALAEAGPGRRAAEPALLDPTCLALAPFPEWADARWEEELERLLAAWPPVSVRDAADVAPLLDAIDALPFVAAVERPRLEASGARASLSFDLRLREPVACLRTAEGFVPVAADGTVLPGPWPAPPHCAGRWLPAIAPGAGEAADLAAPGDWLAERDHLDALDVALSLARQLAPADLERLGRIEIDAARARAASPEEPGVRLLLEDRRLVLFGRPPSAEAPGELPAALKWRSLARALALLAHAGEDERVWDTLDVRWDVPEVLLRPESRPSQPLAAAAPPRRPTVRAPAAAPAGAPEPERPRVR